MPSTELPSRKLAEADAKLRADLQAARDALDAELTKIDREGNFAVSGSADAVTKHPTTGRVSEMWSTGGAGLKGLSCVTLAVVVLVVVSRFVDQSGISAGAVEFLSGALLALGGVAFHECLSARRGLLAKEDGLRTMIDRGLRRIEVVQNAVDQQRRAP